MIRPVLWAVLTASAAMATPITFTISAYGSGTLNGVSFTDSLITYTQVTDTTLIASNCFAAGIYCAPSSTSNTVTIGSSTYTLTDSTAFGDNTSLSLAGISDITASYDILDESDGAFSTYNLQSALGPISGGLIFTTGTITEPTSGGTLDVTYEADVLFTATTGSSSVPEPGSLGLMLAGALILHAGRFRVVRR